jgi:hypothetical protein
MAIPAYPMQISYSSGNSITIIEGMDTQMMASPTPWNTLPTKLTEKNVLALLKYPASPKVSVATVINSIPAKRQFFLPN